MAKKKLTFESAMDELQIIYEELEQGAVGLDELEKKMKRVKTLADYCSKKLRAIESVLEGE